MKRYLSKSKIISFRQCPNRLWLEVHKPELRDDSASETSFAIGHEVGEVAQRVFDKNGVLIDINELGFEKSFKQSAELLSKGTNTIFEAGLRSPKGALAFADIMLPTLVSGKQAWDMIEVKSSSSLKGYHLDDTAIQAYIAATQGITLNKVFLAHVDNSFIYQGDQNYRHLFNYVDVTEQALNRYEEVDQWITDAHDVVKQTAAPEVGVGPQCNSPFPCPFAAHCSSKTAGCQPKYPLSTLPRLHKNKRNLLTAQGIDDVEFVDNALLTEQQIHVKKYTLSGETYFNQKGASARLNMLTGTHYFLDFETSMSAVPKWKGRKPYQQTPFQYSLHSQPADTSLLLEHTSFLDLSGEDPKHEFANQLINDCGLEGPIFVYNEGFEKRIIKELADQLPHLSGQLMALTERMIDLLPIARENYYHPSQKGSWSIKSVLPAICPDLNYDQLSGISNGSMAMDSFQEAIAPDCSAKRKQEIELQLLEYCKLDTYAMVRIWQFFLGSKSNCV